MTRFVDDCDCAPRRAVRARGASACGDFSDVESALRGLDNTTWYFLVVAVSAITIPLLGSGWVLMQILTWVRGGCTTGGYVAQNAQQVVSAMQTYRRERSWLRPIIMEAPGGSVAASVLDKLSDPNGAFMRWLTGEPAPTTTTTGVRLVGWLSPDEAKRAVIEGATLTPIAKPAPSTTTTTTKAAGGLAVVGGIGLGLWALKEVLK